MAAISIIVPIYNKERYLQAMLRNLVCQAFSDFECILIDDGSTDGSSEICDKIAQEDARFQVRHIPNGGVSHARNVGLDIATGAYITLIDADDSIPDNYLSALYGSITKQKADLAVCAACKVWDSGKRQPIPLPGTGLCAMESFLRDFARIQKETGIWGYAWGKLFPRQLVGDIRFDESIRLAEDLDFYLNLYPRVKTICFCDQTCYDYLQAAENSSMLCADNEIDYFTQLKIQKKIYDYLLTAGAMNGENQKIMTQRLSDYVYFCLFHSDISNVPLICKKIDALALPERQKSNSDALFRKILLYLWEKRLWKMIQCMLYAYRCVRRIVRKNR